MSSLITRMSSALMLRSISSKQAAVQRLQRLTRYLTILLLVIRGSAELQRSFLDSQARSLLLDFHWGLPGWDKLCKLAVMSLRLGYKVDVITILEITVRLWRPNYHACSLSLLSLTWSSFVSQVHPAVISCSVEPD